MGGRKGYSLTSIVGNMGKVRSERRRLIDGFKENRVDEVVAATAQMLSKSGEALDAIVHGFFFVQSIDAKTREQLGQKTPRERKLSIADKWAGYRRKNKVDFSSTLNRDIVDTVATTIGKKK